MKIEEIFPNEYAYDKDGICYRILSVDEQRCSLHGEFISRYFNAVKIKLSGKQRNCCTALHLEDLNKESRDRLKLKYPSILKER